MHTKQTQPQPLPYHLSAPDDNGKFPVSTAGNDRGSVALVQDEATAAFLVAAANGYAALLDTLQHLVNDLDMQHPDMRLPAVLEQRLRQTLAQAAAGFDPVRPRFELWYTGISVEGDMRSNMERAYHAAVAQQALAAAQQADAEFPQVHLREHQKSEAHSVYFNFKHIEGEYGALTRAIAQAARGGYLNGFKDGKHCAEDNDASAELVAKLSAKVAAGELASAEFNRAIAFAQRSDVGLDADVFLKMWQHGQWPELHKDFGYAPPQLAAPTGSDDVDVHFITAVQGEAIAKTWQGCPVTVDGKTLDVGEALATQFAQAAKANRGS